MKVLVFYKDASDHSREVRDYLADFERQTGHVLETIDPDSKDGSALAAVYDIVEYPTLVALSDDGQLQNTWRGTPLPTISEVSYYV